MRTIPVEIAPKNLAKAEDSIAFAPVVSLDGWLRKEGHVEAAAQDGFCVILPWERASSRSGASASDVMARLFGLPDPDFPEVAFAGRSNVGKSSLLNALTNRNSLARTSNTPNSSYSPASTSLARSTAASGSNGHRPVPPSSNSAPIT